MDNQQSASPLYATLLYEVRKQLDVSIAEYFYLDMVYHLSYQRWCNKSVENSAADMGIKKRGLLYMRDRLIEAGLLEKNKQGFLRVTQKYIEVAVQKVHQSNYEHQKSVQKVHSSVQKVHPGGAKSAPKNNKRITEIKEINKENSETPLSNASGYLKAKEIAEHLRRKQALVKDLNKRLGR